MENEGRRRVHRAWRFAALGLGALLLITNALWLVARVDDAWARAHRQTAEANVCSALRQALAALPVVAGDRSRAAILADLRAARPAEVEYEKEGARWRDGLGYRFGPDDRLVEMMPSMRPVCQEHGD
jgi:hypothetical protein